jgi:hypothetical protein
MKKNLFGLITALLLATPAVAEEHELDMEREMEHIELEYTRAEFEFDRQMREADLRERQLELEMMRRRIDRPQKLPKKEKEGFFLVMIILHLLMAIWVYQDVRRKNSDNGSWIVITLLAGFFGAVVYALIRIGDSLRQTSE